MPLKPLTFPGVGTKLELKCVKGVSTVRDCEILIIRDGVKYLALDLENSKTAVFDDQICFDSISKLLEAIKNAGWKIYIDD